MEFLSHNNWKSPTRCFCQFPSADLKKWAHKRFCEQHSTIDMLSSTDVPAERGMISAVALLDVDKEMMLKMMGDGDMQSIILFTALRI